MERNNVVYDVILVESDRIAMLRRPVDDLYYRDGDGNFVKVADGYSSEIHEVLGRLGKKKRMKYYISFYDSLRVMDDLLQSTSKVLRHLVRGMSYMNIVKDVPIRDIVYDTGISSSYVQRGIKDLCDKDVIRFIDSKKRRTYIVNPVYFYRGSIKSLFNVVRVYEGYPQRDGNLNIINTEKLVNLAEQKI